jgi:hypothetical protein
LIDAEAGAADLLIKVTLPYYAGASIEYRRMAIAAGERAAQAALPALRQLGMLRAAPPARR